MKIPPFGRKKFARWWFQIFFMFTPTWGKIPALTNIFQMGWNHRPVCHFLFPTIWNKHSKSKKTPRFFRGNYSPPFDSLEGLRPGLMQMMFVYFCLFHVLPPIFQKTLRWMIWMMCVFVRVWPKKVAKICQNQYLATWWIESMSKKSHLPRKTHVSKKWPAISGLDAHPNLPVGSPGNVVDPLDSIAEYGTDALRYALLTSSVGKSQSERFGTIRVFWNPQD